MEFKISRDFIAQVEQYIEENNEVQLQALLKDIHYADIAEIMEELDSSDASYLFHILDSEKTAEILLELDEEIREKILKNLSAKEIAEELDELSTDDAADIIAELPEDKKEEVIQELVDAEHARDIVDLLRYDEDTAGGLMAKELVKVNENWNVLTCVKEMRIQAENVQRVHSIYVVDDDNRLKGRLSLKDLLTTSTKTPISEIYIKKVDFVKVNTPDVEVARIMQKYDLEAIPVVDELGRLVGRITIDDVVDVIKEEAEKDYQLAAGISQDVEADDSILDLTRARLPWLVLALFGGFISVSLLESFNAAMKHHKELFFFTPLIAAMAGNVGVQSSAIIVQGLANNSLSGSLWRRLIKEVSLTLLNGSILAILLVLGSHFLLGEGFNLALTVSISLISVIVIASLIGTFIPILLDKIGIDPALATGPFITTSNDIFGILIYFSIAKVMLGF
ncbi:magnesium transporter [Flavobacterium cyanobacteriorum]|uniref:Magnesium transporter MgtE n=1 Tax=Flavobacterium cyanobacteriorum TaxID=2022802 RepID=A0A255Z923_9FLAO|nr:magnesium transporter [Flavobacterium cyanobacteriorum]OYQ37911.1 magnesium transporter [Flavobacterium cyanobacteriorum]